MIRPARFALFALVGLAAGGVVLLGALAALVLALVATVLDGSQTAAAVREPRPRVAHPPVAELGLAA